jgi:bifunctional DNase/RNase
VLRETDGEHRILPIFIGGPEATAIAFAVDGVEPPRPLTHDLIVLVLGELGATLERVVVTSISDGVFYAELRLRGIDGEHIVSCRPSDAIAVAVRTGAPVYASESVLDDAGQPDPGVGDDEPVADEVVEQFREFIDTVNPDDFAS